MKYVTLADLSKTIRENFYKVPHDIDFVVTIPRSGTICGSIISEFLNVPLTDINSFLAGVSPSGGGRLRYHKERTEGKQKVLVVDDTVYYGSSKVEARKKLEPFNDRYDFVFLVVYLEGSAKETVDVWLEDLREYTNKFTEPVLYEWNIFHHNETTMESCIYDIDGVLCVNPPDERNEKQYIDYIKNAVPLFVPTAEVGELLTYRLTKNREITEKWLKDHGVRYRKLSMFNASTWQERHDSGISSSEMKGRYYKMQAWAKLFVESDDSQAKVIFDISGKPVYCVETNKLYS